MTEIQLNFGSPHFKPSDTSSIADLNAGYMITCYDLDTIREESDQKDYNGSFNMWSSYYMISRAGSCYDYEQAETAYFVEIMNNAGETFEMRFSEEKAYELRINISRRRFGNY